MGKPRTMSSTVVRGVHPPAFSMHVNRHAPEGYGEQSDVKSEEAEVVSVRYEWDRGRRFEVERCILLGLTVYSIGVVQRERTRGSVEVEKNTRGVPRELLAPDVVCD